MSKILAKIFGNVGGSVLEKLSGVADKFITTGDEKRAFKKEMKQIFLEAEKAAQNQVSSRWENDMKSDSWLSKNIRPLTLIFLTTVFVILSFFDGNIGEFTINEAYKPIYQTLLMVVYSAYFVGRSIEKHQSINNNGKA